ncbi:uncharacterized protein C8A04DRAFT_27253 [Dichotomopilus funicola]|uniref:Uncharacterized protein n=1 Tax=Dichotomopilus funicola TaxID=1934379 RepID=A0AAN6V6N0_9PEZI|nr:hypothetical protein C8A04DRAFT_27253 [Dichotomopilus funicola]
MDDITFLQQLARSNSSYNEGIPGELSDPFVDSDPSPSPQPAPTPASIKYAPVLDRGDGFESEPIVSKHFPKPPSLQSVPTQTHENNAATNTNDSNRVKLPVYITALITARSQPTVALTTQKPIFFREEFGDETDTDENNSDSDGGYLPPRGRALMNPSSIPSPTSDPNTGNGTGSSSRDSDYDAGSEDNNEWEEELGGGGYNGSVGSKSDSLLVIEGEDQEEREDGKPKAKSRKRCGLIRCLKRNFTRSIKTWNTFVRRFQSKGKPT